MNLIINYGFLLINVGFLFAYIVNLIINLIHANHAKNELIAHPKTIKVRVKDVRFEKRRTYLVVEYKSPSNQIVFTNSFEFTPGEIKEDEFVIGSEIDMHYLDVEKGKKVHAFPLSLNDRRVKLEAGPIFTNSLLVFLAAFNTGNVVYRMLVNEAGLNAFISNQISVLDIFGQLYVILIIALYVLLITYLIDSLTTLPRLSNHNYLKLYGIKGTARVKTFKFGGAKNAKGYQESRMEIEYFTSTGEKVETKLSSYLYSETQEEYIDIIYDPNRTSNVVYLRQ